MGEGRALGGSDLNELIQVLHKHMGKVIKHTSITILPFKQNTKHTSLLNQRTSWPKGK